MSEEEDIARAVRQIQAERRAEAEAEAEKLAKFEKSQPTLKDTAKGAVGAAGSAIDFAGDVLQPQINYGLKGAIGGAGAVKNALSNNLATMRDLDEAQTKTGDEDLDRKIAQGARSRIDDRNLTMGQVAEKAATEAEGAINPVGPKMDKIYLAQQDLDKATVALGTVPSEENQKAFFEAKQALIRAKAEAKLDSMSPAEQAALNKPELLTGKKKPGQATPQGAQGGQAVGQGGGGVGSGGGGGGGGGGLPGGMPGMGPQEPLSPEEQALREKAAQVQLAYDDQYQAQRRALAEIEAKGAADADHAAQRQKLLEDYQGAFNQAAAQVAESPVFSRDSYFANKSTGEKIMTAIGAFVQGIGFGIAGKPELAAGIIERQIDKDLMVQKMNFERAKGIQDATQSTYAMAMKLSANSDEADKVARAALYDKVAKDIESQATKVKGANTAAEYEMLLAKLAERREEALLKAQVAMMKRKGGRGGGGGGEVGIGGGGQGGGGRPASMSNLPPGVTVGGMVKPENVVYTHGKMGVYFNDSDAAKEFRKATVWNMRSQKAVDKMLAIAQQVEKNPKLMLDGSMRTAWDTAKKEALASTSQASGSGVVNPHDIGPTNAILGNIELWQVGLHASGMPGAKIIGPNPVAALSQARGQLAEFEQKQLENSGGAVVLNTGETYTERHGKGGPVTEVAAPRILRGVDVSDLWKLSKGAPQQAAGSQQEFNVPTGEVGE